MAASTKKAGAAGRYGARYGGLARKKVATVERIQRRKHICPECGAPKVARTSTGIWSCRKCNHTFAGGAYLPTTGAGRGARKALRGIREKLIRAEADEAAAPRFDPMEHLDDEDIDHASVEDHDEDEVREVEDDEDEA